MSVIALPTTIQSEIHEHHTAHDELSRGDVPYLGVDTVAVRGPVRGDALNSLPRQRKRVDLDVVTGEMFGPFGTSSEARLPDGLGLRVDTRRGRAHPEARLEFSVPCWLRGDNARPASPAEMREAMGAVVVEAAKYVTWLCDPDDLELMRLDVATDFKHPGEAFTWLHGLSHVPVSRVTTCTYLDASRLGVQTLVHGTSRWAVRVYDRGQHYANRARDHHGAAKEHLLQLADNDRNTVRYELQLRSRHLGERGPRTLKEVSGGCLEELSLSFFHRVHLGHLVGAGDVKVQRALARALAHGIPHRKVRDLAGELILQGYGLPTSQSPATMRKFQRLARFLDLAPGDLVGPTASPMRLDYDRRRLLVGEEALAQRGVAA